MASASPRSSYTVTASRSAFVDVRFGRGVLLDYAATRVSGSGGYAGYYVQPLDRAGEDGYGELRPVEYRFPSFDRVGLPLGRPAISTYQAWSRGGSRTVALPAGRYRLHVIGDATTRLHLALVGAGAPRRLTASRLSPLSVGWADATPADVAGAVRPQVVAADVPIQVRTWSLTFVSMYTVRHATPRSAMAATFRYCIGGREAPGACQLPDPMGKPPETGSGYAFDEWRFREPPEPTVAAETFASYFATGVPTPGDRVAHFEVTTPATIDKVVVLAFSLAY